MPENTILVCTGGKSCRRKKSRSVLKVFEQRIIKKALEKVCVIEKVDCLGFCKRGPIVKIARTGVVYGNVAPQDCKKILNRQVSGRKPIKRLVLKIKLKTN